MALMRHAPEGKSFSAVIGLSFRAFAFGPSRMTRTEGEGRRNVFPPQAPFRRDYSATQIPSFKSLKGSELRMYRVTFRGREGGSRGLSPGGSERDTGGTVRGPVLIP